MRVARHLPALHPSTPGDGVRVEIYSAEGDPGVNAVEFTTFTTPAVGMALIAQCWTSREGLERLCDALNVVLVSTDV